MNDELERRAAAVLADVADLTAADRPAAVVAACGSDLALLARVRALLAALDRADGFLAAPTLPPAGNGDVDGDADTVDSGTPVTAAAAAGDLAGERIGPYKLVRPLGEGGFGLVYLAEQQRPVRRQVAVKVIKLGMDTREVVARFDVERQALALMDHPNIAKVLDAGATPAGRPFFVMELVRGTPITDYCDTNRLTTAERVGLATAVCRAVQHAHGKGVIHRDLKPSNVLVTVDDDGRPVPKVIDFGIAKATQSRLTDRTLFTQFRQLIGTPQYMSPEQADSDGTDVDTRTDVYSLGVVLYELLTGSTPFDARTLRSTPVDAMRRMIREADPPRPSTRLTALGGAAAAAVAAARRTDPKRLRQLVRGELEWITLRAIAKDRTRRYDTAAAMADDLQRYLDGEAVTAGPPGGLYRLGKLARRHRAALAVAGVVLLSLVLGVAGTTVGLVRAAAQRREAERQRRLAEARFADVRQLADDFLFRVNDALTDVPGATNARRMLAATGQRYLDQLSRTGATADPALTWELATGYQRLGDLQGNAGSQNVGDSAGAVASYRAALGLFEQLARAAPADPVAAHNVAVVRGRLADVQRHTGRTADALTTYAAALEIDRRLAGLDVPALAGRVRLDAALESVADARLALGQTPAAAAGYAEAVAYLKGRGGGTADDRLRLATAYDGLGGAQSAVGRTAEASASFAASMAILRDLDRAGPADGTARRNLAAAHERTARLLADTGRTADALAGFTAALAIREEQARLDPADVRAQLALAGDQLGRGRVQASGGDPAAAAASFAAAMAAARGVAALDPANTAARFILAQGQSETGDLQAAAGRTADALASHLAAVDAMRRLADDDPADANNRRSLVATYAALGRTQLAAGRTADAVATHRRAVDLGRQLLAADPDTAGLGAVVSEAYLNLGEAQQAAGATADALGSCEAALGIRRTTADRDPTDVAVQADVATALSDVGLAQLAMGRTDQAVASLSAAVDLGRRLAAADPANADRLHALTDDELNLSTAQAAAGRAAAALASCRAALDLCRSAARANPSDQGQRRSLGGITAQWANLVAAVDGPSSARAADGLAEAIAILTAAADRDPADAVTRQNLAQAHEWRGDLMLRTNRPADALASYGDALRLQVRSAAADPASGTAGRALAVAYLKVAAAEEAVADAGPVAGRPAGLRSAAADLRRADDRIDQLRVDGRLAPADVGLAAQLDQAVGKLDEQIAAADRRAAATQPTTGPTSGAGGRAPLRRR